MVESVTQMGIRSQKSGGECGSASGSSYCNSKRVKKPGFAQLFFFLLVSFCIAQTAFAANWLKLIGTDRDEFGKGIAVDADGNVYVTGYTEENLDGNKNLGSFDIFLIKYDSKGKKLWSRLLGTEKEDYGLDVAVNSEGDIYITGYTYGNLGGNHNAGNGDIFIARYKPNGSIAWIRLLGTPSGEEGRAIALDKEGNVYVAGHSGGDRSGIRYARSQYNWDILVTKYDPKGNEEWTKFIGTPTKYDYSYGIAVDHEGNSYVTGTTNGNLAGIANAGSSDVFITKFDTEGKTLWTNLLGSPMGDDGKAIAVDSKGNSYITGITRGNLDGYENNGLSDIFIAKYDTDGEKLWTRLLGSPSYDYGFGIEVGPGDKLYLTGSVGGILEDNRYSGSGDIFISMHDSDGNAMWTNVIGKTSNDLGYAIAVDSNDHLYITGETGGNLAGNRNSGRADAFVWKLDIDSKPPVTTASLAEGAYQSTQTVTLSCDDAGGWGCSELNFTTVEDGFDNAWELYTAPFTIERNTTIKFSSIDLANNMEEAQTLSYFIDSVPPAAKAAPPGTIINTAQSISLKCTDDNSGCARIHYTLDGKTPDRSSAVYDDKIGITEDAMLKFVAVDKAGNLSPVITEQYFIDRTAPSSPAIIAESPTNDNTPIWKWKTRGGSGIFRISLDDSNIEKGEKTSKNSYEPPKPLSEGLHTLYVQERDAAGNWSEPGKFTVSIDTTVPFAPAVTGPALTNSRIPAWSWTPGGGGGGVYRFKLNDAELRAGDWTYHTSFKPKKPLSDGPHTLHVQERDDAGNWSESGSFTVVVSLASPTDTTISIISDAASTSSRKVKVALMARDSIGIVGYYISESRTEPDTTGFKQVSATADFSAVIPYTLSEGKGDKTVYAWFKNAAGRISPLVSYTINLTGVGKKSKWVKLLGTSGDESSYGVAVDKTGNVYITGHTEGDIAGNTNSGGLDILIAKYDAEGNNLWTRLLGTENYDYGLDIAIGPRGNIYVTGNTEGDLDGNENTGDSDIFIAKYSPNGNKIWTRLVGTNRFDYGLGIAVDLKGNVYITGNTESSPDEDNAKGDSDILVAKFDTNGNRLWTKMIGTEMDEIGYGIAVDSAGNTYITGNSEGNLQNTKNAGGLDVVLIKFDPDGKLVWSKLLGTKKDETGYGVAVDSTGNIYITGNTEGNMPGGTNAGGSDVFVAKYGPNGNRKWLKLFGTPSDETSYGVTLDAKGNVYVTGHTRGGLDGNQNEGSLDIFVAKFDGEGKKKWINQLGTSSHDYGLDIDVDSAENVYVTGHTGGSLQGNVNSGRTDILILKL